MSENKGEEFIEITGLWLNESQNGVQYMSGYLGSAIVYIFRNKYKEADNQPDYRMVVKAKRVDNPNKPNSNDVPF